MAVKRRVLWFSDDEWSQLRRKARERGVSVSAYLRAVAQLAVAIGDADERVVVTAVTRQQAQAQRDMILRRITRRD